MILVITDSRDPSVEMFNSDNDSVVVTPSSLSVDGWVLESGGVPALPGTYRGDGSVSAVLVRIVRVSPSELIHVHADDRAYVAHEMTAFLAAFLNASPLRRVNPVEPGNLTGLARSREAWLRALAGDGVAVCVGHSLPAESAVAVVVGNDVFVDGDSSAVRDERVAVAADVAARASSEHIAIEFCAAHPTSITGVGYQALLTAETWAALKAVLHTPSAIDRCVA